MSSQKKGHPFLIIAGAIVLLAGLSFVPWGDLTNNTIKDFNLLSDLFPGEEKVTANEDLDPALVEALKNPVKLDTLNIASPETPLPIVDCHAPDGSVIIEDYTFDGLGLKNLRRAIANKDKRPVRIAVIGDSYIEGDILTMHMREALQDRYGGMGVGYMPASSTLTKFRTTVRQQCNGWTRHEVRQKTLPDDMRTLPGEYFTSNGNANSSYTGADYLKHLDAWDKTTVLARALNGGSITLSIDSTSRTLQLPAQDMVSALTIPGRTSSAKLSASAGVDVLGVFLDGNSGILVDNMSLRGNSGLTHRNLSVERASQMRPYVDYDMIVVEYGINALSSQKKSYGDYCNFMTEVVNMLKACYPNADIVMLGIGDRGQKLGGEVKGLPTSPAMVAAQRDAARNTGALFWDTREAMGGENSVLTWREKGLINPDYIHLNHKGGQQLANLFVNALVKNLSEPEKKPVVKVR